MSTTENKASYKSIIAAMIGNMLGFFDFYLFGFLVPIFSPAFFPSDNAFISMLYGYTVFAAGYLCKPIGAIIFGHFGDRFGRRVAFSSSLFLMAFATMFMGVLPTYVSIGYLAPSLMMVARILQGISVGGKVAGGMLFTMEHTNDRYRGFVGGIFNCVATSGVFFGSLASFLCALSMMPTWAWRIPFLLGGTLCFVGLYLRKHTPETLEFNSIKKKEIESFPLLKGIKENHTQLIFIILSSGYEAVAFLINFVYLPVFLGSLPAISKSFARFSGTVSLCFLVAMLPVFGYLSDKIGRTVLMKAGIILSLFSLIILFRFDSLTSSKLILGQITFAICLAMFSAPWSALAVEILDKRFRYSCLGFGYALSGAIFGGTAPLVAATLVNVKNYGHVLLAGYITLWALLGFLATWKIKRLSREAICIESSSI